MTAAARSWRRTRLRPAPAAPDSRDTFALDRGADALFDRRDDLVGMVDLYALGPRARAHARGAGLDPPVELRHVRIIRVDADRTLDDRAVGVRDRLLHAQRVQILAALPVHRLVRFVYRPRVARGIRMPHVGEILEAVVVRADDLAAVRVRDLQRLDDA